ncbi:histidine phosphatase family protein [Desulfosediminicola ganghwensis]|uniref:histidine phosphatase family protein n=1 Tax=Desulfosediminicola ganghwensis TaxID=2569540 RepID=UPI00142EB9FC|nr:histidine phosphatase family protein [Desulfosediminicola ganghwensis]
MDLSSRSTFKYGLFRHGETTWNKEKRVQGHGDSPLTDKGIATLRQWAVQLQRQNWQHILCSDLGRVQQSVGILNEILKLPVTTDQNLREQNWGKWEGMRVKDVYQQFPEELGLQVKRGWDFQAPGGESRRAVRDRLFQALLNHRLSNPADNTLVVCHLGVIKCAIYAIANRKFMEDEPPLLQKDTMHTIAYHKNYTLGQLNIPLEQDES